MWYWLNTVRACGGVRTNKKGIIIDACPYYKKWLIGRHIDEVVATLSKKRQLISYKPLGRRI
jgi:hypothetical protein